MSPEQWNKVVELFHAAREKNDGERVALLASSCSDNPSLRAVVEQMLRDDQASSGFLNKSPLQLFEAAAKPQRTTAPDVRAIAGVKFGRYELISPLGHGGMGEVWMAHDPELERPVALKFMAPGAALNGDVEQLTREARAASALNHPNIVTVYEVIRHEETSIIVMEMIEGTSLRAICGVPQPMNRVVQLGFQIAKALTTAHSHGIVHRDVKPENILVREDGYVKVLDFGLAHVRSDGLTAGCHLWGGTLRYMSPEQARAESISPASDVFSLGLVLYELATGKHAFPNDSPFGAVHAMLTQEPVSPSSVNSLVPAALNSLILKMLAKHAAARPSAREVETGLGKILPECEPAKPAATCCQRESGRRLWLTILAVSLIVLGALAWFVYRRRTSPEFTELRIQPLTSQSGWEGFPALSPDGRSIAFTWTERLDRPRQIYVKELNDSVPVKLTNSDSEGTIGSLVWSPDGTRIAFKREYRYSGAIFAIPSSGGNEQKLLDVQNENSASAIDWSPDGAQLAFSETMPGSGDVAIYLFKLRTGEKRKLTSPPVEATGDWDPKFSPDGQKVAFKRVNGFWADDIYVVPASGGTPRRVTVERRGIWGHAWAADGRSLIVSVQRAGSIFGLWRLPLNPHLRPERLVQGGIDAVTPTTSPRTNRIAWVSELQDINIYRISAAGGGVPESLIASTLRDQGGAYSPDGRIAFVSDRSGSREIWMARADGSNPVRVTNFNGPDLGDLQWSPDGHHLAFYGRVYGHSDIFSLDCAPAGMRCGTPKRVISGMAEVPTWSADGKSLYFASNRTGRWEVWKQPVFDGVAKQVTRNGGFAAHESHDGKWLYFSKNRGDRIWRMPNIQSGNQASYGEEAVVGPPNNVQQKGWALTADEIVFIDLGTGGRAAGIRAYRISTKETRVIATLAERFADTRDYALSISSDSRWVLYSQLDRSGSNVMVADNIR